MSGNKPVSGAAQTRDQRLAAKLRENLLRRKAQARARQKDEPRIDAATDSVNKE